MTGHRYATLAGILLSVCLAAACVATGPADDPATDDPADGEPAQQRRGFAVDDADRPGSDPGRGAVTPGGDTARWTPAPGGSWQIQLQGTVDTSVDAEVFEIDGTDNSESVVRDLQARGRKVICYFSAGSHEDWRDDASRFPAGVLGRPLDGWPGERWLDIRALDVLEPIMADRIQACADKGFDAVDPDNVDGYTNNTGFALSAADQLAYNRMLTELAHERGLAIGLKNNLDQVEDLVGYYDFAVNEECLEWDECDALTAFTRAGKPVYHIEYDPALCGSPVPAGFSSVLKRLDLGAWRSTC